MLYCYNKDCKFYLVKTKTWINIIQTSIRLRTNNKLFSFYNEYLGLVPWVIYDNDGGWESEVEREIVIVEDGNCFVEKNRDSRDLFKNKMVN